MTEYKCRKHHQLYRNKICLEKACYQCRKFDVELCEKCYKNSHLNHNTVSLTLFLEYLKMGLSKLRIQELENENGRSNDLNEIQKFLEIELQQCDDIPKRVKQNLIHRINEFSKKRQYFFNKLTWKLKQTKMDSERIFSTRILFHYARDLYLGLKQQESIFSNIILPIFKEELSLSLSFTKQYYQKIDNNTNNNLIFSSNNLMVQQDSQLSSHSCFMPHNCAVSSANQKSQNNLQFELENPIQSMNNIVSIEGQRFKLNLNLFQGIISKNFQFESQCFQPSYYMQKMFMVGRGYVAYQCARHLYYYNLANNQVQIIHSLPKLNNMQMMVEELNQNEMIIFENNELRIVCKITGATLCSQKTDKVSQIRALNSTKVAYFSQYIIYIWDRILQKVTNTIKLNLLAIQDIIEISKNKVCIGANDHFLFIYDLTKNKFIKKLDLEPIQKDRNINCDNLIFCKVNKNQILTSFRGSCQISFWNLNTYKCVRTIMLQNDSIFSVVRLNCHALALGCLNKFHIFDTATGNIARTIYTKQTMSIGDNEIEEEDQRPELIGCIYAYDEKTILTLSQKNIKIFN